MASWTRFRERAERYEPYESHVSLRATSDTPEVEPEPQGAGLVVKVLLVVLFVFGLVAAAMLRSVLDGALGR